MNAVERSMLLALVRYRVAPEYKRSIAYTHSRENPNHSLCDSHSIGTDLRSTRGVDNPSGSLPWRMASLISGAR